MEILNVIRIIFILLDILLAFGFVYALIKSQRYRPDFNFEGHHAGAGHEGGEHHAELHKAFTLRNAMTAKSWESINKKFMMGTAESSRLAIIEADALVDTVLKSMNIEGEHLADRLNSLGSKHYATLDALWRAHRLRNDLVHTTGFILRPDDARVALDSYEAFLHEIGALNDNIESAEAMEEHEVTSHDDHDDHEQKEYDPDDDAPTSK